MHHAKSTMDLCHTALGCLVAVGLCLVASDRVSADAHFADPTAGLTTGVDGGYTWAMQPTVVTSDNPDIGAVPQPGTHTTTPGVPAFGVNVDGVGDLLINLPGGGAFDARCTASLLEWGGGRFALTAAHCVTDGAGNLDAINASVGFDTPSGFFIANATAALGQITPHPLWNGDALDGFDVAILDFGAPLDPAIPRYALNTTVGAEVNATNIHVGYGNEGYGGSSVTGFGQRPGTSGTKRAGPNRIEDDGLGTVGFGGGPTGLPITNNTTQLTYDFDSGVAANDGFGFFGLGPADTGWGGDEVGGAQGDSGGPSFIDLNNLQFDPTAPLPPSPNFVIAGVHSYGIVLNAGGGITSDVNGGTLDSSWGEFSVDARVADPALLSFIQAAIPEPGTVLILGAGVMCIVGRPRRRANLSS